MSKQLTNEEQKIINRIGVEVVYGCFGCLKNENYLIGGDFKKYGEDIARAIGAKEYRRNDIYFGIEAMDLVKRIEFDKRNDMDVFLIYFYWDKEKVIPYLHECGSEMHLLFNFLKEGKEKDQDILKYEEQIIKIYNTYSDYGKEQSQGLKVLEKAIAASLLLDDVKDPNKNIAKIVSDTKNPDFNKELGKEIISSKDVFRTMEKYINFTPYKNEVIFNKETLEQQIVDFIRLKGLDYFIDLGIGKRESLPEEIQKHLDRLDEYYKEYFTKMNEWLHFEFSSEDELFKKLSTKKSSKTRAVLDVYDAVKPIDTISNPVQCVKFIEAHRLYPQEDTNVIILFNTKHDVTDVATFKTKKELLEICSRPWGINNIIISEDKKIANKMKDIINQFHVNYDTLICKYDAENKAMNIESDYYGTTYQVNISEKEISDNLEERVNRVSNIRKQFQE